MKKKELVDQIIEIELDMFQKVRSINPSICKEHPNAFKLMREMGHIALSKETLRSYYDDLKNANSKNRNLMTEKYAKMTYQPLKSKSNKMIEEIVSIESEWLKSLSKKFPHIISHNENYFKSYLTSELETYSQKTLKLYYNDIITSKEKQGNLARIRYEYLVNSLGYDSIEEAEESKTNTQ
ncbi:MAG: DUF4125 family protein [Promethearchaeati archaeon]